MTKASDTSDMFTSDKKNFRYVHFRQKKTSDMLTSDKKTSDMSLTLTFRKFSMCSLVVILPPTKRPLMMQVEKLTSDSGHLFPDCDNFSGSNHSNFILRIYSHLVCKGL